MMKAAQHDDLITQQMATTKELMRYVACIDLPLDHIPREVQAMIGYIYAHLFEPTLSVEAIKTACGTRNNNVTTRFQQATGMGIWKYIVARRLEAAAVVLSTLEVNMYILAAAVGYTEEAFSKAFKNAYECSPFRYHRNKYKRNG